MDPRLSQVQHEGTQRATSITSQATATGLAADGNTNAIDVGESTLVVPAQAERAPEIPPPEPSQTPNFRDLPSTHALTPVNVDRLELELKHLPDKQFVNQLCNDLREGTRIGYTGPRLPHLSKNLPSATQHPQVVSETLAKEVELGRVAGPFNSPQFSNLQVSPIGVIPKKHSDKFRLIFHLSYPKTGGSINSCMSKEDYSL